MGAHPAKCTLAYWHKPLFSSGDKHGDDPEIRPLWEALYAAGVEIVLNGHDCDVPEFITNGQGPCGTFDFTWTELPTTTGYSTVHANNVTIFPVPLPGSEAAEETRSAATSGQLFHAIRLRKRVL